VRAYLALLGAGFQRQTAYRLALVAGLDVAAALTYVWVLEGMFAVVWAPWVWEMAEAIRSGEFLVELLRPGDLYLRLVAFDLGRTLSVLVTRTAPVLAGRLVLAVASRRLVVHGG
jgi:ABC-2 type transport system permease protein